MQNQKQVSEIKGYSLFNDIEDKELQTRNRAVILTNMMEDGWEKGMVNAKASLSIMTYFSHIAEEDKKVVYDEFIKQAKARGFVA